MAEEMDRDKTVFVIGEEVARYNGAYKVTKGLLDRFGEDRVIDVSLGLLYRIPIASVEEVGLGLVSKRHEVRCVRARTIKGGDGSLGKRRV